MLHMEAECERSAEWRGECGTSRGAKLQIAKWNTFDASSTSY